MRSEHTYRAARRNVWVLRSNGKWDRSQNPAFGLVSGSNWRVAFDVEAQYRPKAVRGKTYPYASEKRGGESALGRGARGAEVGGVRSRSELAAASADFDAAAV